MFRLSFPRRCSPHFRALPLFYHLQNEYSKSFLSDTEHLTSDQLYHLLYSHTYSALPRTSSNMTHLGLCTRRAFILAFYPHFSLPQHPFNPSPPSCSDSLLASLTPAIPLRSAWQRAFGDLSFETTSPRLESPVPAGPLTETRCCVPPSSLPPHL